MTRQSGVRKGDLLGLVGLLLLLVWTPAYVAQGEDARDVSAPAAFSFPAPRVGDRIVLDLFLQADGHDAVQIPGVGFREFRLVEAGEAPVPATHVEVERQHAMQVDLAFASYRAHEVERRVFYDESGRTVWIHEAGASEGSDGELANFSMGSRPRQDQHAFSAFTGTTVRYHPERWVAATEGGIRDTLGARADDDYLLERRDFHAHVATVLNGRAFYGIESGSALFADALADIDPRKDERPDSDGDVVAYVLRGGAVRLPGGEGAALDEGDGWAWFSPDFAAPVGRHSVAESTTTGERITVDVLPVDLTRGTGPVVPLLIGPGLSTVVPTPVLPMTAPEGIHHIRLGDLMVGTEPIVENVSRADIVRLLRQHAPASLQDALDEDALFLEYRFLGIDDVDLEATSDDVGVPDLAVPLVPTASASMEANHPARHFRWDVAFLDGAGMVQAASLLVRDVGGQVVAEIVTDLCTQRDQDGAWPRLCGQPWTGTRNPDTEIVDPASLRGPVLADLAGWASGDEAGEAFVPYFAPVAFCEITQRGWSDMGILEHGQCGLFVTGGGIFMGGSAVQGGMARIAWTHSPAKALYLDLTDVRPVAYGQKTPLPEGARAEPPIGVQSDDPIRITAIDAIGRSAMLGGLLLIIVAALMRLWVLATGGSMTLATFLFSRVTRADSLLQERRAEIMALVEADPGLTVQDVTDRLGYSRTATLHHLGTLVRTGQLVFVQNGRQRHFFTPAGTERERQRIALSRDALYADVFRLVDAQPGITLVRLTEEIGRHKSRLSRIVGRLANLGLLRPKRDGRTLRVFPVDADGSDEAA